ncbi:MAG: PHP domain-containing protein [Peptococcaceae bacterium]|nr:PHP domain-containing protein [Peptococcaceae bacterium]MDH7524757.1 PHP domain-containing protein [Peptococcaceae bacterium]
MKFFGDYHVHTTLSDGRGTVEEMVEAASRRGLKEFGLAEHGPASIGTGVKDEGVYLTIKEKLRALQAGYPDLQLYTGAEADIIGPDGRLDLSKKVIKQLDYLLVGLHPYVLPQKAAGAAWLLANQAPGRFSFLKKRVKNWNTKAVVEAVHSCGVTALAHPGLKMEIDIPEAARACCARDVAWEINTGHRFPSCREVLEAARCGVDFIVNSDAHFPETVGCLDYGSWVLEKAGVPCERVRNALHEEE